MATSQMSPQRVLLFFVPHVALVLIVAIGEYLWCDWFWPFLLVSAALPWWCRMVGTGWSRRRAFMLGPGVLTLSYLVGFVIALLTSTELPFFALLVLALALAVMAYSLAVFQWRIDQWTLAPTILGLAFLFLGYPVLGLALLVVAYAYIVFERQRHRP